MNTSSINLRGLQTLRQNVAELANYRAQVGLFQDTAARVHDKGRIADNPTLGAIHEQPEGLPKPSRIPRRSFLLAPLWASLGKAVEGVNWVNLIWKRGPVQTLGTLGALGESVVLESFAAGGPPGQPWTPLSPRTIARKKRLGRSLATLIETAQMRKAVSSRVQKVTT